MDTAFESEQAYSLSSAELSDRLSLARSLSLSPSSEDSIATDALSSKQTAGPLPYTSPPPHDANAGASKSTTSNRPTGKALNRHLRKLRRNDGYAANGHHPTSRTIEKVVAQASVERQHIDLRSLPATKGAYEAKAEADDGLENCTLEQAVALGLEVFPWDGRCVLQCY